MKHLAIPRKRVIEIFRITLAKKVALIQLLFALLLSVIIGLLTYKLIFSLQEKSYQLRLADSTSAVASMTHNFIESNVRYLDQLLDEKVLDKYIHSYNSQLLLEHFQYFSNYFESITYVDSYGIERVRQHRDGTDVRLRDISDSTMFLECSAHPNEIKIFAPSLMQDENGTASISMAVFTANYFGEKLGLVAAEVSLDSLAQYLEDMVKEETMRILVVDGGNLVIFDSWQKGFGKKILPVSAEAGSP